MYLKAKYIVAVAERMETMIRLELSNDEARMLEMFLLMTTQYREGQVETYQKLMEDWGKNGAASEETLKTLSDNAQHWMEQCVSMDGIRRKVSELLTTPRT